MLDRYQGGRLPRAGAPSARSTDPQSSAHASPAHHAVRVTAVVPRGAGHRNRAWSGRRSARPEVTLGFTNSAQFHRERCRAVVNGGARRYSTTGVKGRRVQACGAAELQSQKTCLGGRTVSTVSLKVTKGRLDECRGKGQGEMWAHLRLHQAMPDPVGHFRGAKPSGGCRRWPVQAQRRGWCPRS